MSERRYIPLHVRRHLRQEAYFGCAVCGEPILDYHHIVPWSVEKHNNPEHMVALCPTHHRIVGKMAPDRQYEIKNNPKNRDAGMLRGFLATDKHQPSFVMGTNTFINTPTILSYYGVPIITYRVLEGQSLLSAYIPKDDFFPELKIVDNDIIAWVDDLWDFQFSTNYLKMQRLEESRYFEIDLRHEHALVSGNIRIGETVFVFNATSTNINSRFTAMRNTFTNCGCGFAFGDYRQKLLLPNYAMRKPSARLVSK
ncbi:HNH endonuclease [Xinfangfangia pollutisoli]|uniref:HNH endonuclease n=1 Tax=Xinfangfangia pollutisoli TaxID=2865960 RepID=UPI001CD6F30D|nr:HNH endonuclease signature motif containing protein [Xinfangfangia pollutisoli]